MPWRGQINDRGVITRFKDTETGEVVSAAEYQRRMQMQDGSAPVGSNPMLSRTDGPTVGPVSATSGRHSAESYGGEPQQQAAPEYPPAMAPGAYPAQAPAQTPYGAAPNLALQAGNPLLQPGAQPIGPNGATPDMLGAPMQSAPAVAPQGFAPQGYAPQAPMPMGASSPLQNQTTGLSPTAGMALQGKNLRLEGIGGSKPNLPLAPGTGKPHGFLDATSIAILLPTLVLLALIIAAAHKKRLFPWQTIRTFNPPSGLMTPRDYERSYLCPPNLRRHGRMAKRNPQAAWTEADGVVLPFGFLARTHLPVTIPIGRLPNKNMFLVAPSGSGKTTLMRAIIKALLAKPCVIIALEAKANDPNLDEKREGFKYSLLPEAEHAGFNTLYFNPLDSGSIHWNPLDGDAISFASSIVQDVNSLPPEEQHWAERDHGYIASLVQLLKWGGIQVSGEDENGQPAEVVPLPCNPRGLMLLVNNRRNIVESLRRLKTNPEVDAAELSELTLTLTSIIRTDTDWDKNIQGVRGRLRMFKNPNVLRVTERSNVDLIASMHKPTVLIFGAPASLGPDAESLSACFVYQLQQALHTRYGTKNILPLFAFFDEYQTLNIDIAGRLSAIVRGANGGLTVILQNISQIAGGGGKGVDGEIKTIFSNSAIRVCLHNADETTAKFFSEEIGKHAVVVPGISDHYQATGFGVFPTSWNRIHSQQVVARVDTDSIKRMEKHHALVFLSPAGDPEYGEVKPLMVDLRGIEEIARLHLLHNVSARQPQPGMALGNPETMAAMAGGGNGGIGGDVRNMSNQAMNTAAHLAQDAFNANIAAQAANAAFPAAPEPVAYNEVPLKPVAGPVTAAPVGNGNGGAARICGKCSKPAGKGKFCIECGSFIGVQDAAPAQPELVTSASILSSPGTDVTQNAPPFPGFVKASDETQTNLPLQSQRQPVTSFNLDPSKMGFAQPLAQPAAQPQGNAQPRRNGEL
jgi:hypothetical protein